MGACLPRRDANPDQAGGRSKALGRLKGPLGAFCASSARAAAASASCRRAARRHRPCLNQVAIPPASTPRITDSRMTTNSGRSIESDGSVELSGSNDTVTQWRLATAKITRIAASGSRIAKLMIFRIMTLRTRWTGAVLSAFHLAVAVEPLAHFLAGLEERHAL